MHGIGNDYIYFDEVTEKIENPNLLSALISDRHFGVGGDGIVLISPSEKADFKMRIFNSDGSEAKMCGNATRCIGKYVYEKGLTQKSEFSLETLSGIKNLKLETKKGKVISVKVDMGKPILTPQKIPINFNGEHFINKPVKVNNKVYLGTAISMGNPHFVIFTENVKNINLASIGPAFEFHPFFPERVNVEFAELTENGIFMRVWERGSGETLACGTGASAVFAASVLNGYIDKKADISLLGGVLSFELAENGHIFMSGPAEFVFEGVLSEEQLEKLKK